jgi:NADH-quinone oxidoreductase subunit E
MISAEGLKEIDRALTKYPADQKQSAVMSALAVAQEEHGWLSPELMQFVADYLGMPAVAVQEVATFYTMYELKPVGKHKITLCTNLPCQLARTAARGDGRLPEAEAGHRLRRDHA